MFNCPPPLLYYVMIAHKMYIYYLFKSADTSCNTSFSTVALVGVTPGIPLSAIAHELVFCLNSIGRLF